MRLAEQWGEVLAGLPRDWETASLALTVDDEAQADRAALILGPATPGRRGTTFRLSVDRHRRRLGASAEVTRRVLARLDAEGIDGRLELVGAESEEADEAGAGPEAEAEAEAEADVGVERRPTGLAEQWDALLESLPPDWSHLYAEVSLDSSDFVERAALLMAPANPALFGGPRGLRFRCAHSIGYGVAVEMARRCLERLDEEHITGRVRVVRVVSDAHPVGTQGPVWYVGGRPV